MRSTQAPMLADRYKRTYPYIERLGSTNRYMITLVYAQGYKHMVFPLSIGAPKSMLLGRCVDTWN